MIHAARRADRIVTLAESIRDDLITSHGVPAGRINVVPHGVEATSAEALADVLAATLPDDGLARSLRARARARGRAFTWPRSAELTRDAYERAINVPGTNGG
jgi:hypothetical protein